MTREQVLALFPEVTEDQVTSLLNTFHSEKQKDAKTAEKLKESTAEIKTLREQLEEAQKLREEAENKNLSEAEKIQKQNDAIAKQFEEYKAESERKNAELIAQLTASRISSYASEKGLVGEEVSAILKAFGGDEELAKGAIDNLVKLTDEREKAAVSAYELKMQQQTGTPGGNRGGEGEKNAAAKELVIAAAKRAGAANESILANYRRD